MVREIFYSKTRIAIIQNNVSFDHNLCTHTCSRNKNSNIKLCQRITGHVSQYVILHCILTVRNIFPINFNIYVHVDIFQHSDELLLKYMYKYIINTILRNSSRAISPCATSMMSFTTALFFCRSTVHTWPRVRSCSCQATRRFLINCFQ